MNEDLTNVPSTCRVVVEKKAGEDTETLCGQPAVAMWYIFSEDEPDKVLDVLLACQHHSDRYDQHHTLAVKDLRGFVHLFFLPKETTTPPTQLELPLDSKPPEGVS